jgi:uncharacterized protein YvpB
MVESTGGISFLRSHERITMGKKEHRKSERQEAAIRAEIRTGLKGNEQFHRIAAIVSERYPATFDQALAMTVEEYAGMVEDGSTGFGKMGDFAAGKR